MINATFEENDPALFNVRFLCETFKFLYNKMTNYATSGIFGQLSYWAVSSVKSESLKQIQIINISP